MRFDGLDPWPEGVQLVECVSDGVWIDLHNAAWFAGARWRPPDTLELAFDYDPVRAGAIGDMDLALEADVVRFAADPPLHDALTGEPARAVLAHLRDARHSKAPRTYEVRDDQVYRWAAGS